MVNQTADRFGFPGSLVRAYDHWVVLLRQQQITLGSLVMCAKSDATAFSALPAEAFAEMHGVIGDIEAALGRAVEYEKINYLMLMMVDPNVHFHVFPRYSGARSACDITLADQGWPAAPKLDQPHDLELAEIDRLRDYLRSLWPR